MTAKEIRLAFRARDSMLHGIETLARAVAVTLGPRGRNVAINRSFGTKITKDGVTVAREIELEDKFEDMGVQLLRQVAIKTSYQAGDGTTTAVVLADAILRGGVRAVTAGMNPMDLKRGVDRAVEAVVAELKQNARSVASNVEIAQVATISANGDGEIGQIIADAMAEVGKNGVIMIEEGRSLETESEVITGIQFDRSYISPYFVTNRDKMRVEMEEALILVCETKLSSLSQILPLLEKVVEADKPLLIIAEDFEAEVRAALVVNRLRGGLKVAAVKAPAYGELRKAILQDIALLTGGTVISEELGLKLESISLDRLGRARKIRVDKQNTTIAEGGGSSVEIAGRIAAIRAQLEATTSDFDRGKTSGAAGTALRRDCCDPRRRRDRVGDQGEEGPHPQRHTRHPCRRRGGHPAGRWGRAAARKQGDPNFEGREPRPAGRHQYRQGSRNVAGEADCVQCGRGGLGRGR